MNIQAMMKQAQKLQKDMLDAKESINKMEFEGKSSFVTVVFNGNKEMKDVKLDLTELDSDDVEMLQDMIMVAVNDAMKKIDDETERVMGKYTKGMPGLF